MVRLLARVIGVGIETADMLVHEVLSRNMHDRRALPMRMTASWFRSLDLPHTRLWRDSTAPESGLPSDCHPDCIIVLEAVRMSPGEIEPRTRRWKKCVTLLDSKSPIQGPWCRARREARARERHRHWSGG